MRYLIVSIGIAALVLSVILALFYPLVWFVVLLLLPICVIGGIDFFQRGNNIRRNYPFFGSINELVKNERHIPQEILIQQSWEGRPFSRLQIRLVKKRAEDELKNEPFGTEMDYAAPGHDWLKHSAYPAREVEDDLRITIGGPGCAQPYSASLLNIAAMSFGSISSHATRALGEGAKIGGFAMNTGEGGLTDHHTDTGADLIWQIGTAYFGCRDDEGRFDPDAFAEKSKHPLVRMIEIKISQGAKPGFGAILPASKNTEEIARYRQIEPHEGVRSPPFHSEFHDAKGLLEFIERLRDLSGGKPAGIKLCLGQREEFDTLCQRMVETGTMPDFITIAGGEGGSGAASLDSIHHVGAPGEESLVYAHDTLTQQGLRNHIRLLYAGKIISGFDLARSLALGADACYSARGMMFALGCVQSLKCNTNRCPTGITTMKPSRVAGLVVSDKKQKVADYHRNTLYGLKELLMAAGLKRADELRPHHIERRIGPGQTLSLAQVYPAPQAGNGTAIGPARELAS
jgi:glutamate synthase domain-containing protein 2